MEGNNPYNTTIVDYIKAHREWSEKVFGPGEHTEGLLKHIAEECDEVRKAASGMEALEEVADIIILAIDLAWRLGYTPKAIAIELLRKQRININREWPKITDPNEPTRHKKD